MFSLYQHGPLPFLVLVNPMTTGFFSLNPASLCSVSYFALLQVRSCMPQKLIVSAGFDEGMAWLEGASPFLDDVAYGWSFCHSHCHILTLMTIKDHITAGSKPSKGSILGNL